MIPTQPRAVRFSYRAYERSFNLVIEKLIIPTYALNNPPMETIKPEFQSRNRETYDSNLQGDSPKLHKTAPQENSFNLVIEKLMIPT